MFLARRTELVELLTSCGQRSRDGPGRHGVGKHVAAPAISLERVCPYRKLDLGKKRQSTGSAETESLEL